MSQHRMIMRSFSAQSLVLLAVTTSTSMADVPRLIHYQGKLRQASGSAFTGTVQLRFRLYDDAVQATNQMFDETHAAVDVANGLFNVLIGSETAGGVPDSALDAAEIYLGVSINGGSELAPRSLLATTPHAVKSAAAERLVRPDGYAPAVSVDAAGNVGVGTTTPSIAALLELSASNKGILIPRLTDAERDAISTPPEGLLIFNVTSHCFNFHDGQYWFEWCGNCIAPPTPIVSSNSPVCAGSTLALSSSAIPNASYNWTGPNGFTSTQQNPTIPNATTAATGVYSLIATVNNCNSPSVGTSATVHPIPSAPTAGSNSPVCVGQTLNLTASTVSGATYAWSGPDGFSSSAQNPSISGVTTAAAGTYGVTVTVNGCVSSEAMTTVIVNTNPNSEFSWMPLSPQSGQAVSFTPATSGASYNWTFPNGTPASSTVQSPSVTWYTANGGVGTFTVMLTVTENGCSTQTSHQITISQAAEYLAKTCSNDPLPVGYYTGGCSNYCALSSHAYSRIAPSTSFMSTNTAGCNPFNFGSCQYSCSSSCGGGCGPSQLWVGGTVQCYCIP